MATANLARAMMVLMTDENIDTSTMLGRFLWLVKHRAGDNQRELSRMIGKPKKSEGFIGAKISALRLDPNAPIESDTLDALCRACGVRMQWLATGEGARDVEPEAEPDRYPARATAIARTRDAVSTEAIRRAERFEGQVAEP